MSKQMRHREVESIPQGHTATEQQHWEREPLLLKLSHTAGATIASTLSGQRANEPATHVGYGGDILYLR